MDRSLIIWALETLLSQAERYEEVSLARRIKEEINKIKEL
jgi:hypothetical protein|tara:strand:+ start:404 stop:523 length:120 start_codon:yes stop_codon:yes gene_type:complete